MEFKVKRINDIVYGPPLHIPDEYKGVGDFYFKSCKKHGDKILQIDGKTGQMESYSSVLQRSIRTAMEMRRLGIKEGDIITTCATNSINSMIPIIAASFLSAATANLDPSLSLRDSVYLLNIAQPKMIFVEESAVELVENIIQQLSIKVAIVVMGLCDNHLAFRQFLTPKEREEDFQPVMVEDLRNTLGIIYFSSGSTGMPKAVRCSQYGLLHALYAMKEMKFNPTVSFHITSFYWITAALVTLLTVQHGGTKIIASTPDADLFLQLLQKYKITYAFLPTNMAYQFTKENTSKYDTSSPENIIFGGSIMNEEQLKRCKSYFSGGLLSNAYGQTETSNYITAFTKTMAPTLAERYPESCGLPAPGSSIKIVDPETEEILPPNQPGEIRVRSKGIFIGYHNEDASKGLDSDGYLKTGDIGYFNEDHCLFICDRIKEMFKYKSWHIVPASVEKVIHQHPGVKEALVIGIPHREDGDHPMALVVLKNECSAYNEEDIKSFVDGRVLDREKLRAGVKIIREFPRTVTGKIRRAQIRKSVIEGKL